MTVDLTSLWKSVLVLSLADAQGDFTARRAANFISTRGALAGKRRKLIAGVLKGSVRSGVTSLVS